MEGLFKDSSLVSTLCGIVNLAVWCRLVYFNYVTTVTVPNTPNP